MHLFTDYVQPLTVWLNANPNWALFITFIIAFSESLAVVGSIIPGTVTMTAIGILAGSGVMRIDLTLLAAMLGAVAGDSLSYSLGYTFRNSIVNMWPFSRYPNWINYGKDYFDRHGGKSVLIGRFVGPLRSLIPLIAGMLHMNRWYFLLANVVSAIGWSLLYVLPGVLIGTASSELSTESATRLFIVILMLLVIIWLTSLGLKWLFIRMNLWLRVNLDKFWLWAKHSYLKRCINALTPAHETNHYPTAALIILFVISFILSIAVTVLVIQGAWAEAVNNPVYLFLQSVRTRSFDVFFIIISFFTQPISLTALVLAIMVYTIYYRDWRMLRYWLSLCFSCAVVVLILVFSLDVPETAELVKNNIETFYPLIELTFATSLFGFLIFYISTRYRTLPTLTIRVLLVSLLFLSGIAAIYLGDSWLTSVVGAYLIGLLICISHWVFFRRLSREATGRSQLPIIFSCFILVISSGISCVLYYKTIAYNHRMPLEQYVLSEETWWHQSKPLLPLYTTNRIGQRKGLLNIQYVGPIESLQQALVNHGWKNQSSSFFYTLLMRIGGNDSAKEMPLMAQLYLNRKPALIMTYNPGGGEPLFILRLWRSNYRLLNQAQPIWVGSLYAKIGSNGAFDKVDTFKYIQIAMYGFQFSSITLTSKQLKYLPQDISPVVLFIKAPQS